MSRDGIFLVWREERVIAPVKATRCVEITLMLVIWLKFKVTVTMIGEKEEVAIKVVKIRDGTNNCHIGFLTQHIGYGSNKEKVKNKYGQVTELYKELEEFTKKGENCHFAGMASFCLLNDIQDLE
jgi:hypothetical protein